MQSLPPSGPSPMGSAPMGPPAGPQPPGAPPPYRQSAHAPPPRRKFPWWGWVGIGCAGVLALGVVAAALFGYAFVREFASGRGCLPNDFPIYLPTRVTGVFHGAGAGPTCRTVFSTPDPVTTTAPWYLTQLDQGDWEVTANKASDGEIDFDRRSNHRLHGIVTFLINGSEHRIQVEVFGG